MRGRCAAVTVPRRRPIPRLLESTLLEDRIAEASLKDREYTEEADEGSSRLRRTIPSLLLLPDEDLGGRPRPCPRRPLPPSRLDNDDDIDGGDARPCKIAPPFVQFSGLGAISTPLPVGFKGKSRDSNLITLQSGSSVRLLPRKKCCCSNEIFRGPSVRVTQCDARHARGRE